jgi:hypothetical protein
MRLGSEQVAKGQVLGPEDFVYDAAKGLVYTSCEDGWIKRVTANESVADSVVENWVNTGGRPLGLAFDGNGHLIVADAEKVTVFSFFFFNQKKVTEKLDRNIIFFFLNMERNKYYSF